MESLEATARYVKTARGRLSLTQEELGDVLGRDRRSIGRYERGEEELPPSLRLAIEALLIRKRQKTHSKKPSNGSAKKGNRDAKTVHARSRDRGSRSRPRAAQA